MTTTAPHLTAHPGSAAAPPWFRNAVIDGLQGLVTLMLPGTPAAEVVPLTTLSWVEVLWRLPVAWVQDLDLPRIGPGFVALAGAVDKWPAPRQLLAHLPPRPAPPLALPQPRYVPGNAQRQAMQDFRRRRTDAPPGWAAPVMSYRAPVPEGLGKGSDAPLQCAINPEVDAGPQSQHRAQGNRKAS